MVTLLLWLLLLPSVALSSRSSPLGLRTLPGKSVFFLFTVFTVSLHSGRSFSVVTISKTHVVCHHDEDGAPSSSLRATTSSLIEDVDRSVASTHRGLSADATRRTEIEELLVRLEAACPLEAPARDGRMEGRWRVEYSTAPPPSNGRLGPFTGIARQIVDLEGGTYVNLLSVGDDDDKNEAWPEAELRATWCEWDGVLLTDDSSDPPSPAVLPVTAEEEPTEQAPSASMMDGFVSSLRSVWNAGSSTAARNGNKAILVDYGATSWKVDFDDISVRLFGITLVTKKFDNVSRVWRMSYLDDNTRIVRAGRTGKGEDEFVFYMKRDDAQH